MPFSKSKDELMTVNCSPCGEQILACDTTGKVYTAPTYHVNNYDARKHNYEPREIKVFSR